MQAEGLALIWQKNHSRAKNPTKKPQQNCGKWNISPFQLQFISHSSPEANLFSSYFSVGPAARTGEDGVDLCSGCSPLWSLLSWPLPSRWESHTGWQGWPAAGWLVAWSWWCRWPPAQSGPGGRCGERKKCGESRQERKRREGERVPEGTIRQVKVEMEWEKSHWMVLSPTIRTEEALNRNLAHFIGRLRIHIDPNTLSISVLSLVLTH